MCHQVQTLVDNLCTPYRFYIDVMDASPLNIYNNYLYIYIWINAELNKIWIFIIYNLCIKYYNMYSVMEVEERPIHIKYIQNLIHYSLKNLYL